MKMIFLMLIVLLLSGFAPDQVEPFKLTLPVILAILGACYEAVSRIIPTRKVWSIIGKLLEILTWLSNLLNRKKK
jgi:hypothetical protein